MRACKHKFGVSGATGGLLDGRSILVGLELRNAWNVRGAVNASSLKFQHYPARRAQRYKTVTLTVSCVAIKRF